MNSTLIFPITKEEIDEAILSLNTKYQVTQYRRVTFAPIIGDLFQLCIKGGLVTSFMERGFYIRSSSGWKG